MVEDGIWRWGGIFFIPLLVSHVPIELILDPGRYSSSDIERALGASVLLLMWHFPLYLSRNEIAFTEKMLEALCLLTIN